MLTNTQKKAIKKLNDAGFAFVALAAKKQWEEGRTVYIDNRVYISHHIRNLVRQGNKDLS